MEHRIECYIFFNKHKVSTETVYITAKSALMARCKAENLLQRAYGLKYEIRTISVLSLNKRGMLCKQ